jgi:hypothetical protein
MTLIAESGLDGEYVPSPTESVRTQVADYEASGGVKGATLEGRPVVILTSVGAKSGKVRKNPVMRIVDGDRYGGGISGRGARQPVLVRQSGCPPPGAPSGRRQCQGVRGPRSHRRREAVLLDSRRAVLAALPEYRQLAGGRDIPILVLEPIAPRTPVTPLSGAAAPLSPTKEARP